MGDLDYRPFPEKRDDEFSAFMRYAFSPEQGPYDPEADDDDREHLAEYRGLFDGEEAVAVCGHHDFTLRIRGRDRDAAGLSAVASPPEHRRQGHIERLLRESLTEYREDEIRYSVLWPFEHPFYRRYGWGTVSRYRWVKTPPEQLAFAADATDGGDETGEFRRLDEGDYEAAADLLAATADRYDFTMARTAAWWRENTLRGWQTDPFVYGLGRDDDLRALLSYTFTERDDGDGKAMVVSDAAVADPSAWDEVFRFCRDHDSQVERVRLRLPADVSLLDRVDDPRAVTEEVRAGPMFRLVDVPAALRELAPDPDLDAEFTLAVDDPLVGWHDRPIRVTVAGGEVDAERVDAGGDPGSPDDADVAAGIGPLSQLYAGYRGVDDLRAHAALDIGDDAFGEGLAADLGALFPPRPTFLREAF
ncbi:GNAT family N-acetyltransferase [Halorubrum ezzemoulense]|uniref:GNAT family N-acetyltransferase n=1 Tax=Halorubrum ezzemoulense TaxID=337243 RepID=UPI00232D22A8|nr:GNAT family N-acetyltransferase [Halorubrum ezzemoulense]MDB2238133.1 GNAT family N-acetyltransferase [Halorubrum ezzemoulense]MDB2247602.1 GNAT family N-acetyltransferase [Halorubrum ezzemoulense]